MPRNQTSFVGARGTFLLAISPVPCLQLPLSTQCFILTENKMLEATKTRSLSLFATVGLLTTQQDRQRSAFEHIGEIVSNYDCSAPDKLQSSFNFTSTDNYMSCSNRPPFLRTQPSPPSYSAQSVDGMHPFIFLQFVQQNK